MEFNLTRLVSDFKVVNLLILQLEVYMDILW